MADNRETFTAQTRQTRTALILMSSLLFLYVMYDVQFSPLGLDLDSFLVFPSLFVVAIYLFISFLIAGGYEKDASQYVEKAKNAETQLLSTLHNIDNLRIADNALKPYDSDRFKYILNEHVDNIQIRRADLQLLKDKDGFEQIDDWIVGAVFEVYDHAEEIKTALDSQKKQYDNIQILVGDLNALGQDIRPTLKEIIDILSEQRSRKVKWLDYYFPAFYAAFFITLSLIVYSPSIVSDVNLLVHKAGDHLR